jgi:FixJ family two-component response regulator
VAQRPSLIAVVDDESSVCRALERLLQSAGFDVVTFTHGAAFLQSLEARQPDCLIVDLHMSPMSGFELQSRLGQMAQRIPVVIITGHDTPESNQRVMDAGAAAYLRKPVDDQVLIDTVTAAIEKAAP